MNIQDISDLKLMTMKRQHEQRVKDMQDEWCSPHRPLGMHQRVDDLLAQGILIDMEITRRTTK